MTKLQLMQAAFQNFGEHGYNGGSLAQIAEVIGIKKQSIYTYFKSKDELYLAIYEEAMQFELAFVENHMKNVQDLHIEQALLPLLQQVELRFEQYVETKFFIRCSFLTPHHLQQTLNEQTYTYLDAIQVLFERYFSTQKLAVSEKDAAISFLVLLESLQVEMLYGGNERFHQRLAAGWNIFYRGITK